VSTTQNQLSPKTLVPTLEAILEPMLGPIKVHDVQRLKGGYSREIWSFDAAVDGGRRPLILCADTSAGVVGQGPYALSRVQEAALLHVINADGVPAPDAIMSGDKESPLERPFLVMDRVPGTTAIGPLHRDPRYIEHRAQLALQLAEILARIHRTGISHDILGPPPDPHEVAEIEITHWTAELQRTPGAQTPTLARATDWMKQSVPTPPSRVTLVHGYYRIGNILHDDVGPDGPSLRSVVDWEMAHFGDPLEDVAWAQLACWRVNTGRVGGLVELDEWGALYAKASGRRVDPEALRFWEVLGSVKMACLLIRAKAVAPDLRERSLLAQLFDDLVDELDRRLLPHIFIRPVS